MRARALRGAASASLRCVPRACSAAPGAALALLLIVGLSWGASLAAERKARLKQAQAEAKREIDEYRALREAKLRTAQPEAQALDQKVLRVTAETDRKIAGLECVASRGRHARRSTRPAGRAAGGLNARALVSRCRAEYQRNKDQVLALLMQVVMSIDNPHGRQ